MNRSFKIFLMRISSLALFLFGFFLLEPLVMGSLILPLGLPAMLGLFLCATLLFGASLPAQKGERARQSPPPRPQAAVAPARANGTAHPRKRRVAFSDFPPLPLPGRKAA